MNKETVTFLMETVIIPLALIIPSVLLAVYSIKKIDWKKAKPYWLLVLSLILIAVNLPFIRGIFRQTAFGYLGGKVNDLGKRIDDYYTELGVIQAENDRVSKRLSSDIANLSGVVFKDMMDEEFKPSDTNRLLIAKILDKNCILLYLSKTPFVHTITFHFVNFPLPIPRDRWSIFKNNILMIFPTDEELKRFANEKVAINYLPDTSKEPIFFTRQLDGKIRLGSSLQVRLGSNEVQWLSYPYDIK